MSATTSRWMDDWWDDTGFGDSTPSGPVQIRSEPKPPVTDPACARATCGHPLSEHDPECSICTSPPCEEFVAQ